MLRKRRWLSFRHSKILRRPLQPEDDFLVQRAAIAARRLLDLLPQRGWDADAERAELFFVGEAFAGHEHSFL